MTIKDFEMLFDYGYWANKRLFAVMAQLPPEQFTQSVGGSYESVRTTMVHIMSAEWGWLDRCGGPQRGPRLDPNKYPTLESVIETWAKVERWLREFLSKLKDDDLSRKVEFTLGDDRKKAMPLGEILQHAANHGVHHRGQAALLLRMLGKSPGNIDLPIYFAEKRGVPAF